jgi:eukaryotic-like serine/threonine-protein kinase
MALTDNGVPDKPLDALALAYDEALAAGLAPPETPPVSLAPELVPQWQRLQQCLARLEQDRLRRERETTVEPIGATPFPTHSLLDGAAGAQHQIGRFQIIRELGRGGFGIVFLARDPLLRREVALKVPRPEALLTDELRRRFRREAEAAARLSHLNLIAIHEVGEVGPIHYLITAYCSGPTLSAWLKQQDAPVTPHEAARLLAALADAVAHMHSQGVLHRDIKPSNILLQRKSAIQNPQSASPWTGVISDFGCRIVDFDPKLTDFGLAKFTGEATHPTHTGTVLGTPAYMAPEQADGRLAEVTAQSDVYALGVVLYELLTGRPPFQGGNDVATVQQVLTEEPLPPRRLRRGVPRDLETICLKCLEKEPKRRYASTALLLADLRAFQAGQPILARPAGAWERAAKWARRRPAVAALLTVTTAALLALTGWAIWYNVKLREHAIDLQNALNRAESGERRLREENYAIQIKLADTMQGNDPAGLLGDLLNGLRPGPDQDDLRGFEWYYLWNVASRELHLRGHRTFVAAVAISPDGSVCASGSSDGEICLWNMRTGKMLKQWQADKLSFVAMAFTGDGRNLATCASINERQPEFVVWDVANTKEVARLKPVIEGHLLSTAIHSDGGLIAFSGYEVDETHSMLGIWNWRTGQVRYLYREMPITNTALRFSPDGCTLAAGRCLPCIVACWDLASGEERHLPSAHFQFIHSLSFSPDGKFLASGSLDGTVKVWDLVQTRLHASRETDDHVDRVAFIPDGKMLAVSSCPEKRPPHSDAVTLWNMPGLDRRKEALKPEIVIKDIVFSPDGQTIAVGCFDSHVRLWRPFAEDAVSTLEVGGKKEAWSVAFSPDSQTLAVGYDDEAGHDKETLKLWDVATRRERANLRGHDSMVSSVVFAPDGRTLISASYDKQVKTWDVGSQKVLASLRGHTALVKHVACSPDGQTLASVSYDKVVKLWDASTEEQRFSLEGHTDKLNAVAFAPSGKALSSAGNGGELRIWDVATGEALRELKDTAHILALAYAPGGQVLASANKDGVVKLHELSGEGEPRSLIGHKGEARTVAFSPDGKTLATGGDDRTVRLWQVATGRELLVFKDLPDKVNSVAFSPDGRHLAAAIHDGSVRLWHAAAREE